MKRVGEEYAKAMYDLCKEEQLTDKVLTQMRMLSQVLSAQPKYLELLSAPNLSKEERCKLVNEAFAEKVERYLLSLLKILTEKGLMKAFPAICVAYEDLYNADHGIISVKATTAISLSAEQEKRLTEKLEKITGKQITLINTVDPAMLGGVRLDFDGKRMDDSVRHRLDALRATLEKTTL